MRPFARYGAILALLLLMVANPFTAYLATGSRGLATYALMIDAWLAALALAGFMFLRTALRAWFVAFCAGVVGFLPWLVVAEAGWVWFRARYGGDLLGQRAQIYRPDPLLVYTHLPDARGRQVSAGNFDVEYVIDGAGRKAVEPSPGATRTIHVFGDSFTFGYGVANEDTWPNRLSEALGADWRVLNYGVAGYGLEQMYLSLERHQDEIEPGDLVLFTPVADNLERGLISRTYACGGLIRAEQNASFPKREGDTWRAVPLRDECNFLLDTLLANTPLPVSLGTLYRDLRRAAVRDAVLANADALFAAAERLAGARGAGFEVIFLATPHECAAGAHSLDLDGLATPHASLLPHCPEGRAALEALRFPYDGHLSPAGHAWAAEALREVLSALPEVAPATGAALPDDRAPAAEPMPAKGALP